MEVSGLRCEHIYYLQCKIQHVQSWMNDRMEARILLLQRWIVLDGNVGHYDLGRGLDGGGRIGPMVLLVWMP